MVKMVNSTILLSVNLEQLQKSTSASNPTSNPIRDFDVKIFSDWKEQEALVPLIVID